ncbi:MAG: hypothetical protein UW80_C0041G0005 [Microgenomates group bacterium GW2011_GWC1_44_9]|nr:MAG: hypothetical protein UW80_C0041G0005 [Microgenomates group bacterium GW2011_GWC1_44_9]
MNMGIPSSRTTNQAKLLTLRDLLPLADADGRKMTIYYSETAGAVFGLNLDGISVVAVRSCVSNLSRSSR